MSDKLWSDEEVATLAEFWKAGLSASQIAKAIGNGRSRNSVIGKIHRLGLPMRISTASQASNMFGILRSARKIASRKPRKVIYTPVQAARVRAPTINPRKPTVRAEDIETLNIPLVELQAFQCRAITDDTRFAQRCCGQMRDGDSPYCADHRALYSAPAQGKAA